MLELTDVCYWSLALTDICYWSLEPYARTDWRLLLITSSDWRLLVISDVGRLLMNGGWERGHNPLCADIHGDIRPLSTHKRHVGSIIVCAWKIWRAIVSEEIFARSNFLKCAFKIVHSVCSSRNCSNRVSNWIKGRSKIGFSSSNYSKRRIRGMRITGIFT